MHELESDHHHHHPQPQSHPTPPPAPLPPPPPALPPPTPPGAPKALFPSFSVSFPSSSSPSRSQCCESFSNKQLFCFPYAGSNIMQPQTIFFHTASITQRRVGIQLRSVSRTILCSLRHGCMVVWCTQNAPRWQQFHVGTKPMLLL